MKMCPTCHKEYDDNTTTCPNDGSALQMQQSSGEESAAAESDTDGDTQSTEQSPVSTAQSPAPAAAEKEEITADFDPQEVKQELSQKPIPDLKASSSPAPAQAAKAFPPFVRYGVFAFAALIVVALLYTLFLREGASLDRVEIHSTPEGALATVDGMRLGPTPVITELTLGEHTLRLEMEGYETLTEDIDVDGNNPIIQKELSAQQ